MDRTIRTKHITKDMLKKDPAFVSKCIQEQRVELFKQIPIEDGQPVVLTFKSINTIDNPEYRSCVDPLSDGEIITNVKAEYPPTRHIVVNQMMHETYKEHKSFWSKLKLLFSKKSIYTKDTKEV